MSEKIISENLERKMQPGAVVKVSITANLPENLAPENLKAELNKISSDDRELRKSFFYFQSLKATSSIAVYLDGKKIPYDRIRIVPMVCAELPVDIIQYLSENSAQYNIREIRDNELRQVCDN